MLDKALLRANPDFYKKKLATRGVSVHDFDLFLKLDKQERNLLRQLEKANATQKELAKEVGQLKALKKEIPEQLLSRSVVNKKEVENLTIKHDELNQKVKELVLAFPNIAHDSVPDGLDEKDNLELLTSGKKRNFNFPIKPHWEIAVDLDLVDFVKPTIIAKSRFVAYKNQGAKLVRAISQLMLDTNKDKYIEWSLPVIVNEKAFFGTGQFPKFKDDVFKLENTDLYLSSTFEVQLVNLHQNEILNESQLPICYTATGINFRQEAGSAGKDTKGTIRLHQFLKTELVKFCKPENALNELEKLTRDAEQVLELLKLPYRRILLCSGDMGFSAQKTYDLEVWLPTINGYREVSSCSSCGDFQARRAMIRYRNEQTNTNQYVATLNGTALSVDRIFAAILENYQEADGSLTIPLALVKYLGINKITK